MTKKTDIRNDNRLTYLTKTLILTTIVLILGSIIPNGEPIIFFLIMIASYIEVFHIIEPRYNDIFPETAQKKEFGETPFTIFVIVRMCLIMLASVTSIFADSREDVMLSIISLQLLGLMFIPWHAWLLFTLGSPLSNSQTKKSQFLKEIRKKITNPPLSVEEKLLEIKSLLDKGLINKTEYKKQKEKILNSMN